MTFKEAFEQFAEHFISVNNLSAASQASLKSVYSSQLIALENFKLTDITKRVLLKLFEERHYRRDLEVQLLLRQCMN